MTAQHTTELRVIDETDLRRIAACVNACADADTETLVAMANGEMTGSELWELPKVKAERDSLAAQVAELLEAMRQIIVADKTHYEYTGRHSENAAGDKPKAGRRWATPRELAQEAIAKVGVK